MQERAIFVHGFAKDHAENVRPDELVALKKLATEMLAYNQTVLQAAVESGTLMEVEFNGKREAVKMCSHGFHARDSRRTQFRWADG